MSTRKRAAHVAAVLCCCSIVLHAEETVQLRVIGEAVPGPGSLYRVVVEAGPSGEGPVIAGVSFALSIPAGGSTGAVSAGTTVWVDSPVAPVQVGPGGLRVGALLTAPHDLAEASCEVVSFHRTGSMGSAAFVGELDGLVIDAVVSTVDGRALRPYTRVLSGALMVPLVPAQAAAAAPGGPGMPVAGALEQGGGGAPLGGGLPCDTVEIVKQPPEIYDHWLDVPSLEYPEIQDAIDAVVNPTGPLSGIVVIEVDAGVYSPISIALDQLDAFAVDELYLFSTNGPDVTVIEGTLTDRAVTIGGNITGGDRRLYLGLVFVDDPDITDPTNWRGFTIRSLPGGGPPLSGGGVGILSADPGGGFGAVELRGNRIVDSTVTVAGPSGGGVAVANSRGIFLLRNEIGDNELRGEDITIGVQDADGAGLHIVRSEVVAVSNWIHGNDFLPTTADIDGEGGGIAMHSGSLDLCGNLIEGNRAKVGAGVYARLFEVQITYLIPARFYARDNRITGNTPWEPEAGGSNSISYLGGGMYVVTSDEERQDYVLQVLSNEIDGNEISAALPAIGSPAEAGGGAFLTLILPLADDVSDFPAFESNMVRANIADRDGGGTWAYAARTVWTPVSELRFHNNTVLLNALDASSGDRGSGAFFAGVPTLGALAANFFDASSCVSFENESSLFTVVQAFAECPATSDPWRYSQMEIPGGGNCTTGTDWDLSAGANDQSSDPVFRSESPTGAGGPNIGRLTEISPCVDSGEAALEAILLALTDFEGQQRVFDSSNQVIGSPPVPVGVPGTDLDRGADEVNLLPFWRGDTNGDNNFNIADVVHGLEVLFSAVPPRNCQDAFDANDDGLFNVADPNFMLTALFGTGVIPPPFGTCGIDPIAEQDPTADVLVCDFEVCP